MPRNVRNFWITGQVDGRAADIACGPQRGDGGFSLRIRMRHNGEVVDAMTVWGTWVDGSLTLRAETNGARLAEGMAANAYSFNGHKFDNDAPFSGQELGIKVTGQR